MPDNSRLILEKRFTRKVLASQGDEINKAQISAMQKGRFKSSELFGSRNFIANNEKLQIQVLTRHRFIDMKRIKRKSGIQSKKNYPIYNKIIWGHISNISRELQFGFTEAVIDEMKSIES